LIDITTKSMGICFEIINLLVLKKNYNKKLKYGIQIKKSCNIYIYIYIYNPRVSE